MTAKRARVLAVLAVLIAVIVVAIAARSSSTHPFTSTATAGPDVSHEVIRHSEAVITQLAGSGADTPRHKHAGTNWAQVVLLILIVLVIGGVVWRIVESEWSPWRRTVAPKHAGPVPEPDETTPEQLRAAVDESLESLERGPVTDAIIGCWVRVETAAAAAGLALRPSETSSEFVDRVLTSYGAREDALRRLSALYREARFSSHELGESSREEARACLADIRTDLARVRAPI